MASSDWWKYARRLIVFLATQEAVAEGPPSGQLCEFLRQPELTAISNPSPKFSWIVPTGETQVAYRIQVVPVHGEWNEASLPVWDSGRVGSPQSINVEYRGPALASRKTYGWRVQIWSGAGQPSDFSKVQIFHLGDLGHAPATATMPVVETIVVPQRMQPTPAGGMLVDFGRAAFGYLTVDLPPEWRESLELHYGEAVTGGRVALDAGECIRSGRAIMAPPPAGSDPVRRVPFQDFVRPGNAVTLPERIGVILPFRYAEILNRRGPELAGRLRMHAVHYPFDADAASFRSSDDRLNAVWQLCKDTIEATSFAGIYVDGDRERIPYEADAYINQLGHYYTDRDFALARFSHEYLLAHPTWPTEWRFHSIFMAWTDYMHTGEATSLERNYQQLQARLFLARLDKKNGLFRSFPEQAPERGNADLVDWPGSERDGFVFTEFNTVEHAFLYRALVLMERIAGVLGRRADEVHYDELARRVKSEFRAHFFDRSKKLFRDGIETGHVSFHANMFALAFGLVEERDRAGVLAFIQARGMRCSVYAAQYFLEALWEAGAADAARALIVNPDTNRSWQHMVEAGATMTWESWDKQFKPNLDWNHAWGAAPANLLPRYVLGVRPVDPGFGRVIIAPLLGSLTFVEGRVPTIRGTVEVTVSRSSREVQVQVKRPGNMTAQFAYPAARGRVGEVLVNGQAVRPGYAAGKLHLEIPAGEVKILIRLLAPADS